MSVIQTLRQIRKTPLYKPNLWEISILDKSNLTNGLEKSYFLAKTVSIPYPTIDTERDTERLQNFVTGSTFPDEVSISFYETEELEVTKFMEALHNSIYDIKTNTVKANVNPTIEIVVTLQKFKPGLVNALQSGFESAFSFGGLNVLSAMGASIDYFDPVISYRFTDVIYKSRSELSLDYESGEATTITCTFAVGEVLKEEGSTLFLQNEAFL